MSTSLKRNTGSIVLPVLFTVSCPRAAMAAGGKEYWPISLLFLKIAYHLPKKNQYSGGGLIRILAANTYDFDNINFNIWD